MYYIFVELICMYVFVCVGICISIQTPICKQIYCLPITRQIITSFDQFITIVSDVI